MKPNKTKYLLALAFLTMGIGIIVFLYPRFDFLYHKHALGLDCVFRAVTDGGIAYIRDDNGRGVGYFICNNDPYFNSFVAQNNVYRSTGYAYRSTDSADLFGLVSMSVLFLVGVFLVVLSVTIFIAPNRLIFPKNK